MTKTMNSMSPGITQSKDNSRPALKVVEPHDDDIYNKIPPKDVHKIQSQSKSSLNLDLHQQDRHDQI